MNRRAQSYAMDVVLAVVIFGLVSVAFTSVALLDRPGVDTLQRNAETVVLNLERGAGGCGSILVGGELNDTALKCLYAQDPEVFGAVLRTKGKFCMHIEDEQGRLVIIEGDDGAVRSSWGHPDLRVGGIPCGANTT